METDNLDERLLRAWLRLSTDISNNRIVKNMSYKEALICNILRREPGGPGLTATDLCERTRMLKSQMNHTLKSMEEKGLIVRERSQSDRRQVYVSLSSVNVSAFEKEHGKNLQLVDGVLDRFGRERGERLTGELEALLDIIEEVLI